MHDSSGRRVDGMQHIWTGRWAANERNLTIFNILRRGSYRTPIQDYPPTCRGGEGSLVGSDSWVVA